MPNISSELVSVIIPTFNRTFLTKRAIESALHQTYPSIEILVADDGSKSSTRDKLREWCLSKGVKFFSLSHIGHPGIIRQYLLSKSRGKYVAFLDSDDIWHERKIELQLKIMKDYSADFCATGLINDKILLKENSLNGREEITWISRKQMLKRNRIANSSVLVEKELLLSVGGCAISPFTLGAEDYATWLRLLHFQKLLFIERPLVYYDSVHKKSRLSTRFDINLYFNSFLAILDFANWKFLHVGKSLIVFRFFMYISRKFL